MIKLFVALVVGTLTFVSPAPMPEPGTPAFYDGVDFIEVIDADQLSLETLEERDGKIIIERIIGICEDSDGNGRVLNPYDPDYDYISYRGVKGVEPGDIVLTYEVYNPDSSYVDDILSRFDYIIDTGF